MASLHEYFIKDGSRDLTTHKTLSIQDSIGNILSESIGRVHYDFHARATYISFYIPFSDQVECPEALLLNNIEEMLTWRQEVVVQVGFGGIEKEDARELIFTGRVYLYSEKPVSIKLKERMLKEAQIKGHSLVFRSIEYAAERNKFEKPQAFISHDSRDKALIAEPLALHLTKLMCPVWYDSFSLKVGDSLKDSIESGLKECRKCVFIITPNFLGNGGWSKREYNSIFTREIIEKCNLIIPVWHNVSQRDVYNYSSILADRFAVDWSSGIDNVGKKVFVAISS